MKPPAPPSKQHGRFWCVFGVVAVLVLALSGGLALPVYLRWRVNAKLEAAVGGPESLVLRVTPGSLSEPNLFPPLPHISVPQRIARQESRVASLRMMASRLGQWLAREEPGGFGSTVREWTQIENNPTLFAALVGEPLIATLSIDANDDIEMAAEALGEMPWLHSVGLYFLEGKFPTPEEIELLGSQIGPRCQAVFVMMGAGREWTEEEMQAWGRFAYPLYWCPYDGRKDHLERISAMSSLRGVWLMTGQIDETLKLFRVRRPATLNSLTSNSAGILVGPLYQPGETPPPPEITPLEQAFGGSGAAEE